MLKLRVIISRIWKTDSVLSYYCIDEDPSERRRRNVEAKTHNFSRPKMRGGCGSLLFSWDIVAVERLRLLLGIWKLLRSLENVTENVQLFQRFQKTKLGNELWLLAMIISKRIVLSCRQKIETGFECCWSLTFKKLTNLRAYFHVWYILNKTTTYKKHY